MGQKFELLTEMVLLDLGCGGRKVSADAIGIDIIQAPGVDIVGDVQTVLRGLPEGHADKIFTSHFLEHFNGDVFVLLSDIARVLKPGGELEIVVPHFSNPLGHSDPTHKRVFGLYTFCYWITNGPHRRSVPNYGQTLPLTWVSDRIEFGSYRPNYVRHAVKKAFEWVVNVSLFGREFYEENLTWIFPSSQLRFVFRKN